MDRLSGSQIKQLQSALLAGFSFDDLSRLTTFELNERLDSIVPPGPMSSVTFDLIMWAEREGRTSELIKALMAARPNNPSVTALGQLLSTAPTAPSPAVNVADQQRRLRGTLLDQFPRKSDLEILLADTLGLSLESVAGGQTQTEVCFNLVKWLWIDSVVRLKPFLAGAVKERPNNTELKALQRELSAG